MSPTEPHHFVADFTVLCGERGVLCIGPSGVSVRPLHELPLLMALEGRRGGTMGRSELLRLPGLGDRQLASLVADGLLVERASARRGFAAVTLQSDDALQAHELAESLAPLQLDLQVLDLDAALPVPARRTLLVTVQQVYRPGFLSSRRRLPSMYCQLNAYRLGPAWHVDPLYDAALGSPCHDCFLGRRAHLSATAQGPEHADWLRFEYLLDEFQPLAPARASTPVERGLVNFHLWRLVRAFTDAHAPRLRPEDLQSTLAIRLLDGAASWQALSHWDLCDCLQIPVLDLDAERGLPGLHDVPDSHDHDAQEVTHR